MKAFPTLADNGHITTQDGMDLRDYFAAKVMQVLIADPDEVHDPDIETFEEWSNTTSIFAYKIADSMMKARGDD